MMREEHQRDEDRSLVNDYKLPEYDGILFPKLKPLLRNTQERLEAIQNMNTRPDDILLTAFPRSGTHWVWEIMNMLISGKAEYTKAIKETTFLEFIDDFKTLNDIKSPRILNTHVPYRFLPAEFKQNGWKIVHVIRNPKDQLVSWYKFIMSTEEELETMTWDEYFDKTMCGTKKMSVYGGWFDYEKEFEKVKSESIHVLYYEDLKMLDSLPRIKVTENVMQKETINSVNPLEESRRLATFLNVDVNETLLQDIIFKCNFTNMKEADKTIKVKETHNATTHYRKGEIGDWKNHFTVHQNEIFEEIYKREMSASSIKVKFCID